MTDSPKSPRARITSPDLGARDRPANQISRLWQRGLSGWPSSYPVIKFPNVPLLVAILAFVGSTVISGDPGGVLTAISRVALAVWAYLELTDGGNLVRRALGLGFLVYLVLILAAAR